MLCAFVPLLTIPTGIAKFCSAHAQTVLPDDGISMMVTSILISPGRGGGDATDEFFSVMAAEPRDGSR